jgi:cupin fold WbuC family metalloprotein
MQGAIQLLDAALIGRLLDRARESPRLRTNHNFHSSPEENPQRFLNVMLKGTYIAPHRHRDPPKAESFLVLEGELAFFTFGEGGEVAGAYVLGRDAAGIDLRPRIWHTMAVLTPYVVCYEVKPGPYSAATDKEFAPWAPREGDAGAAEYLDGLIARPGLG